jgi:hypothetical protein
LENHFMSTTQIPGANPVPTPAPGPQPFRLIREEKATKLGARSTGRITFQVLTDEGRQALFLRISANEGGGFISDEPVNLHAILRCVTERGDAALKASSFVTAFRGRSSNNPGALCAALVHERLLKRDATRPHLLDDGDISWQAWATSQLAVQGERPIIVIGKAATKPVPPPRKAKAKPADAPSTVTAATEPPETVDGNADIPTTDAHQAEAVVAAGVAINTADTATASDSDTEPVTEGGAAVDAGSQADPVDVAASSPDTSESEGKAGKGRRKGRITLRG